MEEAPRPDEGPCATGMRENGGPPPKATRAVNGSIPPEKVTFYSRNGGSAKSVQVLFLRNSAGGS